MCISVDVRLCMVCGSLTRKSMYAGKSSLSSNVKGIKKVFQRRTKEQLHLPEDVSVFVRRVQGPATVEDE